MAKVTLDVTFDGTTTVDRLDGQSSIQWFGTPPDTTSMDIYSVYLEGDDTLEATAGLTGSDWRIKYFRIAGDNHVTTISDLDAGEDRRIETLLLGYNSELSLISTRVDFIYGWEGDKHVIKLGDQQESSIKAIMLSADLNIIQTGVAHVSNIRTDNGDNVSRITVNSGGVGSIKTGDGADRLIVQNGGSVDAVNLKGGDDTVIVRGDARVVAAVGELELEVPHRRERARAHGRAVDAVADLHEHHWIGGRRLGGLLRELGRVDRYADGRVVEGGTMGSRRRNIRDAERRFRAIDAGIRLLVHHRRNALVPVAARFP